MNYGNGKYNISLIGPKKFIKSNDSLKNPDIIKTELWIDNIIEPIIIEKNNIEYSNLSNHIEHNPNNLFYITPFSLKNDYQMIFHQTKILKAQYLLKIYQVFQLIIILLKLF